MLWPQCLHDWIWYFGHGCRQHWRSLGMCDHRALWPHDCMSSFLVWVRRHGPSHPWTSPPGPLCDKPQPTTTHSQTGKWQPLVWLLLSWKCCKNGAISLLLHFRGSRDCFRPECGRLGGWGHVRFMSISRSESVPLWSKALKLQDHTAICWTAGCLAVLTQWHNDTTCKKKERKAPH